MRWPEILLTAAQQSSGGVSGSPSPSFVSATGYVSSTSDADSWTPFTGLDLSNCDYAVFVCAIDSEDDGAIASTSSSGWANNAVTMAEIGATLLVVSKPAPGSETLVIDNPSIPQQYSGILIRVNDASNIAAIASGGVSTMDPPSHDVPAGPTLWIAGVVADGNTAFTAGPAGYSNFTNQTGGGANGATTAIATRADADGGTENPGAFTGGGAGDKASVTIGLYA